MVFPLTVPAAILAATAISTAAHGAGQYFSGRSQKKAAKAQRKEAKRETKANLFENAMNRRAEMKQHEMDSRKKIGKKRAQSYQDTSDLVREAIR